MTSQNIKDKVGEKRALEDNSEKSACKKLRSEQKVPKIASKRSEAPKKGQKGEKFTKGPLTPEFNFVDGDASVPKGWKISSHREEDGRAWVISPQVELERNPQIKMQFFFVKKYY